MTCEKCGRKLAKDNLTKLCEKCHFKEIREQNESEKAKNNISFWTSGLRGIVLTAFWIVMVFIVIGGFGLFAFDPIIGIAVMVVGGFLFFISTATIMVFLDLARDVAIIRARMEE